MKKESMKKYLLNILPLFIMAMCMCTFTACSSDDDDDDDNGGIKGGLTGYWAPMDDFKRAIVYKVDEEGNLDCYYTAYHFINNNTVEKVTLMANINKRPDSFKSEMLEGIMVYYYFDEEYATPYTYEKIDNKIYIVSAGEILTYNGNTIKVDGRGETFTKVK